MPGYGGECGAVLTRPWDAGPRAITPSVRSPIPGFSVRDVAVDVAHLPKVVCRQYAAPNARQRWPVVERAELGDVPLLRGDATQHPVGGDVLIRKSQS